MKYSEFAIYCTITEYFADFIVTVENVTEDQFRDKNNYPNDNKLCYANRNKIPSSSLIHIICEEPVVGNQLRIQLGNTKTQLVICDIRILKECSSGKWGHACVNSCGHCKDELKCRASDGKCSHECAPGYKETKLCNTECDNGTYGLNCREICGHCKNSGVCNKTNGTCQSGCAAGFTGDNCITGTVVDVDHRAEALYVSVIVLLTFTVVGISVFATRLFLKRCRNAATRYKTAEFNLNQMTSDTRTQDTNADTYTNPQHAQNSEEHVYDILEA